MPGPIIQSRTTTYSSAIADATNYTNWVVDEFRPFIGQVVLEVGLGHGAYRPLLQPQKYFGIDLDENEVVDARRRFPNDTFFIGDIADPNLTNRLSGCGIDSVLCVNVLEHIRLQEQALTNMLSALVPGGHLLLFVPAFPLLFNSLDELAGHYRRYRKSDMTGHIKPPHQIVKMKYFNSIGGAAWLINNLIRHQSLNDPSVNAQIRVFDRFVLPMSRVVDRVMSPYFGQSLIVVVKKQ